MPVSMTEEDAKAVGILPSERSPYIKLVNAKQTTPFLFKLLNVKPTLVPFTGGPPAINALLGGQVDCAATEWI
jgi:hypothetical protein